MFHLKLIYVVDTSMSNTTSNDFEKVTSGHEIWSLELKNKCISIFSETVKDRVMTFSGLVIFWLGCACGFVDVVRHLRSRLEVIKEIQNFQSNVLNWNLSHIIKFLFKCPKQLIPSEVEASTSIYDEKKFQILNLSVLTKMFHLKLIYVVDSRNV
jgi:hypothetical protein